MQEKTIDIESAPTLVYSPQQAAAVLGISKSLMYKELKNNSAFPRKMIGGRIVIPRRRLEEYINTETEVSR
ncbi:helix-turn-helix domain-containing protein [Clostridium transplantifaecale]|uniref:helix-turn-helix domain-containing protein n=1 Tax=Clostridium transplantifaecale TaxID=2479838 RepID=UPI000F62EE7A|nr:helix-turn-helix domain-containing protein [Clostridium transplantifaecale]